MGHRKRHKGVHMGRKKVSKVEKQDHRVSYGESDQGNGKENKEDYSMELCMEIYNIKDYK